MNQRANKSQVFEPLFLLRRIAYSFIHISLELQRVATLYKSNIIVIPTETLIYTFKYV